MVKWFQGVQLWQDDSILTMDLAPGGCGVLIFADSGRRFPGVKIEHVDITRSKFSRLDVQITEEASLFVQSY